MSQSARELSDEAERFPLRLTGQFITARATVRFPIAVWTVHFVTWVAQKRHQEFGKVVLTQTNLLHSNTHDVIVFVWPRQQS